MLFQEGGLGVDKMLCFPLLHYRFDLVAQLEANDAKLVDGRPEEVGFDASSSIDLPYLCRPVRLSVGDAKSSIAGRTAVVDVLIEKA